MKTPYFYGDVYVHVLPEHKTISDGRVVELGKEYKATKKNLKQYFLGASDSVSDQKNPLPCVYGMHALDEGDGWINHYPGVGNWICIVRLNTKVERATNKVVALRRKVIAWKQVTTQEEAFILRYQTANKGIVAWVFMHGELSWTKRDMRIAS